METAISSQYHELFQIKIIIYHHQYLHWNSVSASNRRDKNTVTCISDELTGLINTTHTNQLWISFRTRITHRNESRRNQKNWSASETFKHKG